MTYPKKYLSIYKSDSDKYTYEDLFLVGKMSKMLGVGLSQGNHYKSGDKVLNIAKSEDPKDGKDIHIALVNVKNESRFNPWKDFGEYRCYDVDFISTHTLRYNGDERNYKNESIYEIARGIGTGHQNSEKTNHVVYWLMDRL